MMSKSSNRLSTRLALTADQLYRTCEIPDFDFDTTDDLEPMEGVLGQRRAVDAINYAIAMEMDGHNVFVMGRSGTGRRTLVESTLKQIARGRPVPSDWCYVNNFPEPEKPTAIELPAGTGIALCRDMKAFIEEVRTTLAATFESEDYRTRRQAIEQEFQDEHGDAMKGVQKQARRRGIRIMQGPSGVIFAPVRNGEVLDPSAFEKLPEKERNELQSAMEEVGHLMQQAMEDMPRRVRQMRDEIHQLDHQTISFAIGSLTKDLLSRYDAHARVVEFLEALEKDLIDHQALIGKSLEAESPFIAMMGESSGPEAGISSLTRRYGVNVLVHRDPSGGAPVIIEEHPSHSHLIGRIEHRAQMGALSTDFSLIRGGALHEANGGYLVLEAERVLTEPFAWQSLKQALKSHRIRIESIGEMYALSSTTSLDPDPIPLDVKVILIGEPRIYYLLQRLDPEFAELFKVLADFDDRMVRDDVSQRDFARVITTIVRQDELLPIERAAVCRLIEESSRVASDRERLSTEIARTEDLVRESHYWAKQRSGSAIGPLDVEAALESREHRTGRIRERVLEEITRETILIETKGARVGQINGLAVMQLGETAFGRPNRITVRIALGVGKVIDIEREAELGGPLHSKGVLILSGFIASNYIIDQPLSLSATIAFEQSYSGVDGDSASSAELYALLSAIAEVPLKQSFAVTGSINQYGEVQAIGGVNEKIEGFFDVCQARGLTGEQGVLIPRSNLKHLMLRRRVIDAVEAGTFNIYAVETVDQGMAILTDLEPGEKDDGGSYPEGSLNRRICESLKRLAENRRGFAAGSDEAKEQ
jgi:lon-related putative ATP-dependent protease